MPKKEAIQPQETSTLSIVSLVLGAVSLTGPGLLLGIPAIITGAIALKKGLAGRGLSIAGLITGIVSTVLSLLFIVVFLMLLMWSVSHPEDFEGDTQPGKDQPAQTYNSTRT